MLPNPLVLTNIVHQPSRIEGFRKLRLVVSALTVGTAVTAMTAAARGALGQGRSSVR